MARIRTIKPEFWTDSFMVQLPPIARLIFISLWSCADDHGFIPDETERLAMEVMPRESPDDFDRWLQFFEASGRIERFVGGDDTQFLRIKNWEKHQRVDRPSKSKIYRDGSRKIAIPLSSRRAVAEKYGCPPGGSIEASCYYCGTSGEIHWHKTSKGAPSGWVTFPGLEMDHLECEDLGGESLSKNIVLSCRGCNRSKGTKSWFDFFSSLSGIEGSRSFASGLDRNREQGTGNEEQGKDLRAKALLSSGDDDFSEIQIAFDAYNESATRAGWPKAQALTKTRKAALKARLKEAGGIDGWRVALGKAEASPHLCGQNDRGWTADLDFILQAKSFTKLMEGSYDRRPQGAQPAEQPKRRGIDFDLSKFDDYGNRIK